MSGIAEEWRAGCREALIVDDSRLAGRAAIFDLDGTLLHPDSVVDGFQVSGRRRCSYLATSTVNALRRLSLRFSIVLATARSWDASRAVLSYLEENGVPLFAHILEDGGIVSRDGSLLRVGQPWNQEELRRVVIRSRAQLPPFELQSDYSSCLVARTSSPAEAKLLWKGLRQLIDSGWPEVRGYTDGSKLFLLVNVIDKWAALSRLLGRSATSAVGIGDGVNDICWLSQVSVPCTFTNAPPRVRQTVIDRYGMISRESGHKGCVELIERLESHDHITA